MSDILEVTRIGSRISRIVYRANLNFKVAREYLATLLESNLLNEEERTFTTTPKGVVFIDGLKNLAQMVEA